MTPRFLLTLAAVAVVFAVVWFVVMPLAAELLARAAS